MDSTSSTEVLSRDAAFGNHPGITGFSDLCVNGYSIGTLDIRKGEQVEVAISQISQKMFKNLYVLGDKP